jgi:hypothetical protein
MCGEENIFLFFLLCVWKIKCVLESVSRASHALNETEIKTGFLNNSKILEPRNEDGQPELQKIFYHLETEHIFHNPPNNSYSKRGSVDLSGMHSKLQQERWRKWPRSKRNR